MSSFSSVIRKPGGKVAPKVAPKRNIVRKTASVRAEPEPEEVAAVEEPNAQVGESGIESNSQANVLASDVQSRSTSHEVTALVQVVQRRSSDNERQDVREQNVDHIVNESRPSISSIGPPPIIHSHAIEIPVSNVPRHHGSTNAVSDLRVPSIWPSQKARPEPNLSVQHQARSISRSADSRVEANESSGITSTISDPSQIAVAPKLPETPRSKSRRKQTPRASAAIILATPAVPTPPPTQPSTSPERSEVPVVTAPRSASVVSQRSQAEEHFDRVNTSLLKVGEIAAQIQAITRQSTAPSTEVSEDEATGASQTRSRKRRKRNNGVSLDIQDQVTDTIANVVSDDTPARGRGRRRYVTPEDPENQEIDQESTMMGEILDDKFKYGKKSEIEKQMEANWPEILRRRKEDAELRLQIAQAGRRKKKNPADDQATASHSNGEVVDDGYGFEQVVENGQIVIVSREIDRQAITAQTVAHADDMNIRDDDIIYKRVNASTISSKNQIAPGQTWDDMQTELFYQGLKMFGTDFMMISNMIPGKTRKQVKLKYNVEERAHWPRVRQCLSQKETVDLDQYSQMTGLAMSNVADVYRQMEEDEKRLRQEDEARRREEGIISQDQPGTEHGDGEADVAMPSIEGQDADGTTAGEGAQGSTTDRQSTAGISRLGSTTTGRQTAQPTGKKKQQNKKSASTSKRGKQNTNKNRGFEGVEERLGDVGDIGIPGA